MKTNEWKVILIIGNFFKDDLIFHFSPQKKFYGTFKKNKRWRTNTKIFEVEQKNRDWRLGLEIDIYNRS